MSLQFFDVRLFNVALFQRKNKENHQSYKCCELRHILLVLKYFLQNTVLLTSHLQKYKTDHDYFM